MQRLRLAFGLLIAASLCTSGSWADTTQAARFYEDALSRYEKNDDAGAIIQLKNALQQDASYLSAYLLLGQAQLRKGDISGAELSLNTALKMGADPSEVYEPLADAFMRQAKFRELLDKVIPSGLPAKTAASLWLTRAYAHLSLSDYSGADIAIDKAASHGASPAKLAIARGMYFLQRGNLVEARQFADKAVSADSKDPHGWNLKASIAHANGQLPQALDGYARALALAPEFIDVRVARAGLLLDTNRFDEAFKDLEFLKKKHPDEPRAAYLRSLYLGHKGNHQGAQAELQLAAKVISSLAPNFLNNNSQLLMLGALSNFGIKAYEQAKNHATGYIRLHPDHPGARKLLGAILLSQGQIETAIAQLENANRNSPRDPQVLDMLATAYLSGKQYVKAARLLDQADPTLFRSPQLASSLGFSLIGIGRQERGLAYLTQAYTKNPADYRLGSSLVMFNIQLGHTREAVRIAEAFRAKNPKDATAYNLLGVAKAGARDLAGARGAYEKALSIAPGFDAARLNLGKLEAALGNYEAARKQFQALLKNQPKHPQALYELGLSELAAGRHVEALRWLQLARAQSPRNTMMAVKLIDTHLSLGDADKALDLAKEAAAIAPDDFDVVAALGRSYAASGQTDRAMAKFSDMSKLAGFNVDRLEQAASLQLAVRDFRGATNSLNKALTEQPGAIRGNALMAELALKKGQTGEALERAKRLATGNPRSALAQRSLGDITLATGQAAQAAQAYRAALQLEASAEHAMRYQAALRASGNATQALDFLRDWSKRHAQAASIKVVLGEVQLAAGQLKQARATYEAYTKLHGEHPIVLNNLANILLQQGDSNALAIAQRAYKLTPDAAPVNDTLGWALFKNGQLDQALRYLREARLRAPQDASIRYHLAAVLHKLGKLREATSELDQALSGSGSFPEIEAARALAAQLRPK